MRGRRLSLLLVAVPLSLTGCADSEPAPTEDSEGGVIRVQVSGEAEEVAVYRAIAKAYEEENEGAEVEVIEVAEKDDHLQKLTTSFAGGTPPDVFLVNFREYSQFVERGAVEAVGPHLDEVGVDPADFYPAPIEAFTYDDELQCLPQNVSSLVVYYNTELFRAAGLERPPAGWGWDEFRRYAEALTTGDVKGLGIEPSIIRLAPFVWSNGGEIVDDLDSPSRFVFSEDEAAREALEYIVGLVREDSVVPTEEEVAAQDLETRFVTGKLGMYLSSRRDTPVFREVRELEWDVASLPVAEEPVGILHSDAYCVAKEADNLEGGLDFAAFATGETGQTIGAFGGRVVPSRGSVANSPAFLSPDQAPRHSRVFLDAVPVLRRTPVIATWPEIEDLAEEVLTRAFYEEGYSIDQAIQDLEDQTTDLFSEGV